MTKTPSPLKPVVDFFSSVRLAVSLLLILAATSALGTVIPQNKSVSEYMQAFSEPVYKLFLVFDLTDMYNSWWFSLLVIMLTANITCCTVSRMRTTVKLAFGKGFNGFGSMPEQASVISPLPPEALETRIRGALGRRFSVLDEVSTGGGYALQGDKGRWTRVGADVVHVGILIILAGAMVGNLFGFDGFVTIPEGESASTISMRNSSLKRDLGFTVRCNDFSLSYYNSGSVKEFRSSLTILENGKEVLTRDIIVNDPLKYKGITFYQASYGSLGAKDFELTITAKDSKKGSSQAVTQGQSVTFGEKGKEKTFTFERYESDYSFGGKSVGEAVVGTLDEPGAEPKEVVLLARFTNFDKMRKGDFILSISGHEHAYYTGLQVTRDPGVILVYGGFFLMLLGCTIAFFMGRKRMRVTVNPTEKGCLVVITGTSPKNPWWIKKNADQIIQSLEEDPS